MAKLVTGRNGAKVRQVAEAALIIGDWGNSNARLWLCTADGAVLDRRDGPGISALRSDSAAIAGAFSVMTLGWPAEVPALLAGVVGASFGWRDAGYLPCPIAVDAIGGSAVRAPTNERIVWILPGLRCVNRWGEPDTMRGEEFQIAGWAALTGERDALLCLPGTHCKWARVAGNLVTGFHSAISGELFALLGAHSVMIDRSAQQAAHDAEAFTEGVELARSSDRVDLAALLFAARARQAVGAMSADRAPSFLSGIIIGCDIRTALAQYGDTDRLVIAGAGALSAHYASALMQWERKADVIDGDAAMRAGLIAAAREADLINV
jgi:2-dehydro-3-deoxygalactonokinase